ncbi:MAG: hypothetical protein DHS20C11_04880 [Lysobacteraceae bacterium]|nr:MAG: hypothetical protein DHS20C11_04880 [Xanthomonadaceae bacterium]
MNRLIIITAVVIFAFCAVIAEAEDSGRRMGPPPPNDPLIVGEPLPGWKASDQHRGALVLDWEPMGPRPIVDEFWSGNDDASGRVVSIAPHPTDPNTVYIASASGGVWKTTDAGALWTPLTDALPSLNHGCVTIDPSNPDHVYVGTGEYTTGSSGAGIFMSDDAGDSWVQLANEQVMGNTCSGLVVDPNDASVLHFTGQAGYLRSDDGGSTWTTVLTGRASDLEVNETGIFVAQHGIGIHRSTDDGASFSLLTGGLPTAQIGRILITASDTRPNIMYTAFLTGNSLLGLYRSTDRGTTWSLKPNTPDFPSPQGSYDAFLAVHPGTTDELWAGGVFPSYAVAGVITSSNGGDSWEDVTFGRVSGQLHPDQHTIAFGPTGTIWVGNDGGVWRSDDRADTWVNTNSTLQVTQNYQIAVNPSDNQQVMGGTQDNGTVSRDIGTDQWPQIVAGDGGFLMFDFDNPNRRYTTYVYLAIYRLTGGSFSEITGPWGADPKRFIAPLVMDPSNANTLLGGTNRVWRTDNASTSANWSPISDIDVGGAGRLSAIAVSARDSNVIYTGSDTSAIWNGRGDPITWLDRTPSGSGFVSDLIVSPQQPERVFASFIQTSGLRVAHSQDGGLNWDDVSGDLPSGVAVRALEVDWRAEPPVLYAGTGAGVWWSYDLGQTWTNTGSDLPNVNMGDLRLLMDDSLLVAGTYGRGVWTVELPQYSIFNSGFGD